MKERPVLMRAPEVRAVLAGTMTQFRRAVKLPHENPLGHWEPTTFGGPDGGRTKTGETIPLQGGIWHTRTGDHLGCPYGQPGDRLWLRETWGLFKKTPDRHVHACIRGDRRGDGFEPHYRATDTWGMPAGAWRPSIHMPRWASRITLEVTDVRVERLQDISEADAMAEGCELVCMTPSGSDGGSAIHGPHGYRALWEQLNGPGSWDANPLVWVLYIREA